MDKNVHLVQCEASNKNKLSCNMYFSICYSHSDVRMSTTMHDESGLFITVESAYGHINVLNGDGDWKEKAKMANIKDVW